MSNFVARPKTLIIACVVGVAAFGMGYAIAAQPHMEAALSALETAKHELEDAIQDKAGHRIKAISLVNDAIAEVRAGIQAGK
jgi:Tfp pilus assembly protein PilO